MNIQNAHLFANALNLGFQSRSKKKIRLPRYQNYQIKVLDILQSEGFIEYWTSAEGSPENTGKRKTYLEIHFKKDEGLPKFSITTLNRKFSLKVKNLPLYSSKFGFDFIILTTSAGLLNQRESLQYRIGGIPLYGLKVKK